MVNCIFRYIVQACLLFPLIACAQSSPMPAVISAARFGALPDDGKDDTQAILTALDFCKKAKVKKLILPKGRYDFWPARAREAYMFISNNDEGLKRFAFSLINMHDFEIDGQGSALNFNGYICPFVIKECSGIILRNFSIDYTRTFHSEGKILAIYKDSMDIGFDAHFPFKVQNSSLIFTGENDVFPYSHLLEFDPLKKETAYMASDYWTGPDIPVKDLGEQKVRLYWPGISGTPGNTMVFGIAKRLCPAITITDSKQAYLAGIQIYHSGAMGVIAQRSADLVLQKVKVTPSPNSGRVLSVPADATHFVNCSGSIIMDSCVFENQMDDATNIHGIYAKVSRIISPYQIEVQFIHQQQHGFDLVNAGDSIEFVKAGSMVTFKKEVVKQSRRLNKEYTLLMLKKPLTDVRVNDIVGSLKAFPQVHILNCFIGKNRARGLLLGSRNRIVIEKNTFHTAGSAILFEGDASFWYEQSGVRNVTIRNNLFDNCNYGIWGVAAIQVASGIEKNQRDLSRYNRNINISDNTFKIFDPKLVNIYAVDNFSFINNKIIVTGDYINRFPGARSFEVQASSNVSVKSNQGIEDEIEIH